MSTQTPRFENDDQAAQHWLALLRDGDADEKIRAREQLAGIFERRGMLEEATELLEGNGRAGVRSRQLFTRLASLYRSLGRDDDALAASAEAALLTPAAPEPIAAPPSSRSARGRPWYLSTAALILASGLCFPPLSLVLIWIRPWGRNLKIAATVPVALWGLILLAGMTAPARPPAATTAAPATQTAAQAPAATAEPKPAPPTATPRPPTATPEPPAVVLFKGRFEPALLRVGQKLVVELTLENKGERQIEGIRIASSGPWDKYTIVNVMPNGRHDSGFLGGHNFYTGMVIPPGQTRSLSVVAYPNEPGSHEFTFTAHHNNTHRLTGYEGSDIMIGGKVSVIR